MGFCDTAPDSILRNLGATTVLFTGVNVDQRALGTLQDASRLGDDYVLLEDCSGTTSPGYCLAATLYNVRQCFGFVASRRGFGGGVGKEASVIKTIIMGNWRNIHVGVEDDGLTIGGVAVWQAIWRRTGDPAVVLPHPNYPNQHHTFRVVDVGSLDHPIRFAVAELSAGVYGFYVLD
jgi:hypothetical protein